MRVLWITNILFPEAKALLSSSSEFKGSGGWLIGAAESLQATDDILLSVATVSNVVKEVTILRGKSITYYILPLGKGNIKYNDQYESYWKFIKNEVNPDIVDIHGSEFSHGLAYICACGNDNVVLTMQGVMQAIDNNYFAGIPKSKILLNYTLHDMLKGGLFARKHECKLRSNNERAYLNRVRYVIGRTTFDLAYTAGLNPCIQYFHCNETMRDTFYEGRWSLSNCEKHTIFLSQSTPPLKGAHMLFKAAGLLINVFPDLKIRIAGSHYTSCGILCDFFKKDGYHRYLERLVKSNHLEEKIEYLGNLSAEEMKAQLLRSNVFVCPSSVENSSNSISEAHLLGVPCVSSCVGGIPSIVSNDEGDYLYPFDDYVQLAECIKKVFVASANFDNSVMRERARSCFDSSRNAGTLLNIYRTIINTKASHIDEK